MSIKNAINIKIYNIELRKINVMSNLINFHLTSTAVYPGPVIQSNQTIRSPEIVR